MEETTEFFDEEHGRVGYPTVNAIPIAKVG